MVACSTEPILFRNTTRGKFVASEFSVYGEGLRVRDTMLNPNPNNPFKPPTPTIMASFRNQNLRVVALASDDWIVGRCPKLLKPYKPSTLKPKTQKS